MLFKFKNWSLKKKIVTFSIPIFFAFLLLLLGRIYVLSNPQPSLLSKTTQQKLENICLTDYSQKIVSPLFWDSPIKNINIGASSAIMLNIENGDILFEKNADTVIPPASMTKLVVMYVVFEEISKGTISLDDVVPLPPESWAKNAPPQSSLMFLDQGQTVTLRELLLGLAVSSGNDAAIAIADYISGSVPKFINRMNLEINKLGLTQTHFVDPSGYSEFNVTTAREFASFARIYVTKYPEVLSKFHSVKVFVYPKEKNLASWHKNDGKNHSIIHYSTNKALGVLEGVNGLKTGYINESGYNISITAERNSTKILTVTMNGPGKNSKEGNWWRIHDASELLESAFSTIKTMPVKKLVVPIAIAGGKEAALSVQQAWSKSLTIPYSKDSKKQPVLQKKLLVPSIISAPVKQGEQLGTIKYSYNNILIAEIPLIADRTIKSANKFIRFIDFIALKIIN